MSTPSTSFHKQSVCLGLVLGARETGYVVASRDHLRVYGVLNLRKLNSQTAKEARFRHVISTILDRHELSVGLVVPHADQRQDPVVVALRTWLLDQVHSRRLHLQELPRVAIKVSLRQGESTVLTARGLSLHLAARFQQLRPLTTDLTSVHDRSEPMFRRRSIGLTAKERYWSCMFLALGAAMHVLDERPLTRPRP